MISFFIPGEPPHATAQQKKIAVVAGRARLYPSAAAKATRIQLMEGLKEFVPDVPYEGPLRLKCVWYFGSKTKKNWEYKTSKPDTDNLQKMLKDCMTAMGFWHDDAQVAEEMVGKIWSEEPGIKITITELPKKARVCGVLKEMN